MFKSCLCVVNVLVWCSLFQLLSHRNPCKAEDLGFTITENYWIPPSGTTPAQSGTITIMANNNSLYVMPGWFQTKCPANHTTHNGGLTFNHFHVPNFAFPLLGYDANRNAIVSVPTAAIDTYYDEYYGYPTLDPTTNPQITKDMGINFSKNCYAYAFARSELAFNGGGAQWNGLWVNDVDDPRPNGAATILADDYKLAAAPESMAVVASPSGANPKHGYVIEDVATLFPAGSAMGGGTVVITRKSEKFRSSAVYTTQYINGNYLETTSPVYKVNW